MGFTFFLLLFAFNLNLVFSNFSHLIWILSNSSRPCDLSALFSLKSPLHLRSSWRLPLWPYIVTFHTFICWLFSSRCTVVYPCFLLWEPECHSTPSETCTSTTNAELKRIRCHHCFCFLCTHINLLPHTDLQSVILLDTPTQSVLGRRTIL